jgi:hypothetical protein
MSEPLIRYRDCTLSGCARCRSNGIAKIEGGKVVQPVS